ncbi:MAG: hypothetical protein AB9872_06110 [Solidesulfovibrio sp.]
MIIFLSGEGPTDFGCCDIEREYCNDSYFKPGPMAVIISQIVYSYFKYSPLECENIYLVPRKCLSHFKRPSPSKPKSLLSPTKPKGSIYFEANARAFTRAIRSIINRLSTSSPINEQECVAILYRDNDGSHSTPKTTLSDKIKSITRGFKLENFDRGIAMIPRPLGEVWLICAINRLTTSEASRLEMRSPHPHAEHPLKHELKQTIKDKFGPDYECNRETLTNLLLENSISYTDIQSQVFLDFLEHLKRLLGAPHTIDCP